MADIDKALPNDKRPEDEVARRNGSWSIVADELW